MRLNKVVLFSLLMFFAGVSFALAQQQQQSITVVFPQSSSTYTSQVSSEMPIFPATPPIPSLQPSVSVSRVYVQQVRTEYRQQPVYYEQRQTYYPQYAAPRSPQMFYPSVLWPPNGGYYNQGYNGYYQQQYQQRWNQTSWRRNRHHRR